MRVNNSVSAQRLNSECQQWEYELRSLQSQQISQRKQEARVAALTLFGCLSRRRPHVPLGKDINQLIVSEFLGLSKAAPQPQLVYFVGNKMTNLTQKEPGVPQYKQLKVDEQNLRALILDEVRSVRNEGNMMNELKGALKVAARVRCGFPYTDSVQSASVVYCAEMKPGSQDIEIKWAFLPWVEDGNFTVLALSEMNQDDQAQVETKSGCSLQ